MLRRLVVVIAGVTLLGGMGACSYLAPRRIARGPRADGETVIFQYYAPTARRVQLAGDWPQNNWARGDGDEGVANVGLMDDGDGDGVWEIRVEFTPGRYRYLFWVDENTWHLDPGNPEEVPGGPARRCSQLVIGRTDDGIRIQ
jgi:hypothetical protein